MLRWALPILLVLGMTACAPGMPGMGRMMPGMGRMMDGGMMRHRPGADGQAPSATPLIVDGGQQIDMAVRRFEFEPGIITVKAGVPVRIRITSEDVVHGFSIPDLSINKAVLPQETTVLAFTVPKAGVYSFVCSIPCGEGHSRLVGKLLVE